MVYLQLNKFNNLARNVVIMTNVQRLLVSRPVSRVPLLQSGSVEDADARPEVFPRLLPVLLDAQVVDDGRAAAHYEDVDLGVEFLFYIALLLLLSAFTHFLSKGYLLNPGIKIRCANI